VLWLGSSVGAAVIRMVRIATDLPRSSISRPMIA